MTEHRTDELLPGTESIRKEAMRVRDRNELINTFRSTVLILVSVAAITVLIVVLLMPILRIYGDSMSNTLESGNVVISVKSAEAEPGDVIAFYYNNNILVKRVIARSGDTVDISKDGSVYVNNQILDEPYLQAKAYGQTNIDLPYQVPEGKVFVMGDNREVSVDSRNASIGCVSSEQILGKVVFRIWPLTNLGRIN